MTTHWPTEADAGVHLGDVDECPICAQNGPETGPGATNTVPGESQGHRKGEV